jgi:hexosaminidase
LLLLIRGILSGRVAGVRRRHRLLAEDVWRSKASTGRHARSPNFLYAPITMRGHHSFGVVATVLVSAAHALWPLPTSIKTGSTPLRLSSGFAIHSLLHSTPSDLASAISQSENYLKNDNLGRLVVDRGASDASTVGTAKQLTALSVELRSDAPVTSISTEAIKNMEGRDDSYSLTIPGSGGTATLTANTTLGLFRGLTTFSQLWYTVDGMIYTLQAPFEIEDAPQFVCH